MTDDVMHSTQYYIKHMTGAILANLQCRTMKLGRQASPHPLEFNMLVIFSLKNVKQGHKLELTYLYACWIMNMKCC